MKKQKQSSTAVENGQKSGYLYPKQSQIASGKVKKKHRLNRNELCDLMGWTHVELNWLIKYARLPIKDNKFYRSDIRKWEGITNLYVS